MSNNYLFNQDRVIDCPSFENGPIDWRVFADATGVTMRKIVLGQLGDEAARKPLAVGTLPPNFADLFPGLTHLYIWNCSGFTALPALPAGLECLDVRGSRELTSLPRLPDSLDTLDLGDCTTLARMPVQVLPGLERFYFNGCPTLRVGGFLDANRDSPLVEIDGSGSTTVRSIDEFPRRKLRKLVLKGCTALAEAKGIGDFATLDHLNLAGCTALRSLPAIPPALRYLELFGADKLSDFMGQDVGPYDRGTAEGLRQNVAKAFHSRKKFGRDLAVMSHAKLLLLGDGRVGKSTLAKRLQWEELPAEAKVDPNHPLKPRQDEPFTHKVRFWHWETGLLLDGQQQTALEERAALAGVVLPRAAGGQGLAAAVRIWDFGGQEIYHHTHRIFAGEGSLFLLVWREEQPEIGSPPGDVPPEEWKEMNRKRPIEYWLDYIYSMRPDASVALVCTNCPDAEKNARKPDWRVLAGEKHRERKLECFYVDSLAEDCGNRAEYRRLVGWIRLACGREAHRIGILQPRLYRQVSDLLAGWLAENSAARQCDRRASHLLLRWDDWVGQVRKAHNGGGAVAVDLDANDIETITEYLHSAGHLFYVRHGTERAVLVDQEWAADLIYQLLLPTGDLRRLTKLNGGWFYRADLEADVHWKALSDDLQRERLLAYMEESRVVTKLAETRENRFGREVFLATDKWLQPTYETVKEHLVRQMALIQERPGTGVQERFEFEQHALSEFDFRTIQAVLAQSFGPRAVYFRNGLQALDEASPPKWCFSLRWKPDGAESFVGKLDGYLRAERGNLDSICAAIEELLHFPGSPLGASLKIAARNQIDEGDLAHEYFGIARRDVYDVALSSNGKDRNEAEALCAALRAAGIKVNWYRLEECRTEDRASVMTFMNSLRRQPVVVLLLSEAYLCNAPETNWYCAWELADAVIQLDAGQRTPRQTVVVYKKSEAFDSKRLNEVMVPLFAAMAEHFGNAYAGKPVAQRKNFKYYDEFSLHFQSALEGNKCRKLFEERGTLGTYPSVEVGDGGALDFGRVVEAVNLALGRRRRTP